MKVNGPGRLEIRIKKNFLAVSKACVTMFKRRGVRRRKRRRRSRRKNRRKIRRRRRRRKRRK